MNILLAFSPFLVFVVLQRLTGVETGLLGAVAMSLLLLANDAVIRRTMPKVLEIGTVLLFGALALPLLDFRDTPVTGAGGAAKSHRLRKIVPARGAPNPHVADVAETPFDLTHGQIAGVVRNADAMINSRNNRAHE